MTAGPLDQHNLLEPLAWREWFSSHKKAGGKCRPPETFEKVAQPLFRGGLHESFVSISCEIVGEAFVRSIISEVHAPGNDVFHFIPSPSGDGTPCRRAFLPSWEGGPAPAGTPSAPCQRYSTPPFTQPPSPSHPQKAGSCSRFDGGAKP